MMDSLNEIEPHKVYSQGAFATRINKSADWVQRNLVATDKIQYTQAGSQNLFYGEWIINWVIENSIRHSEKPKTGKSDNAQPRRGRPKKNRDEDDGAVV